MVADYIGCRGTDQFFWLASWYCHLLATTPVVVLLLLRSKESACNAGDLGSIFWRREWQSTPVFLLGESHGWRSLVGQFMGSQRVGHDWATNTAATRLPAVVVLIFKLAHNKCSKMGMIVQVFIRTFFFGKDFCSLTNSWSYYHFLCEDLNFLSVNLPTMLIFP